MKHRFSSLVLSAVFLTISSVGAAPPAPTTNLAPGDALQELKDGNQRFISGEANACSDATFTRSQLVNGQAPDAIILSCSDSRVPPEQVFDQELGQLFVVRVAGNVLNADAIASIEYAVVNLGSRLIVILGHESCGAVQAALDTPAKSDAGSPSLNHLLSQIRSNLAGVTASKDPTLRVPVMKNVSAVASELLQRSKIIQGAVNSGQVQIQQGIYDLDSGMVDFWDSSSK